MFNGQLACDRSLNAKQIFTMIDSFFLIMCNSQWCFQTQYKTPANSKIFSNITIIRFCSNNILLHTATTLSMDVVDYWLMAREYSIWNATITSLQFWTADLDPVTLCRATEQVYTTFFYSSSKIWCRFLIVLIKCWSKLVFSGTVHLVVLVDKLSITTVVFFRSEGILKCKHLYGV